MRRMILPIIKKYWKLLLSIVLVSALGCGIMSGMAGAYASLEYSLNTYVETNGYPDAFITTDVVNRKIAEDIRKLDGVEAVNTRLCGDTVMKDERGRSLSVRVFSYSDADLQEFYIWSKADTGERDSVMLEYNFAVDNGLFAGEEVTFRVGSEMRTYVISALVSAPETLNVQITDNSWGANSDFGFAFAPVSLLEKEEKKDRDDAQSSLDDQGEKLSDAEKEAQESLQEGRDKLDEAAALLAEKDALFADAEKTAQENIEKLRETEAQLLDAKAQLIDALNDIIAAKPQLEDGIAQLTQGIELLTQAKQGLAEIDAALSELNETRAQLTDPSVTDAVDMIRPLPPDIYLDDLFDSMNGLRAFMAVAKYYGIEINENTPVSTVAAVLESFIDRVDDDYEYLGSDEAQSVLDRIAAGEDMTGDPEFIRLLTVILRYDESYLDGASIFDAYDSAYERVSYLHQQIDEYRLREIVSYFNELSGDYTVGEVYVNIEILKQLKKELEKATGKNIRKVGKLISEYDSAVSQLDDNIAQLTNQRASIIAQLNENGVQEKDIDKKLQELRTQLTEAQSQLDQIPGAIEQIHARQAEIEDGLAQITEGIAEIERQLEDAREQLDKAHEEYNEGLEQYNESFADAMSEFARLREELEKAYAQLDEQEGYDSLCNQFLIFVKSGYDRQAVLDKALSALGDTNIKKSYTYEGSPVYDKIKQNLDSIDTLSTFMPLVFFVVVLIVVFLFMSLVIKQSRREIGILRALGFKKSSIRLLFCGVELVTASVSVVLGIALGYALTSYFSAYFKDFFPLPYFYTRVDLLRTALAAVLTIAVGEAATLIGTSVISRIQPSEAMTRPAPAAASIPRVLGALTKNAKPMVKFSVSSLLRNKLRFIFSVVCIAASVMMIFSSLAFSTSKSHALRQLYEMRIRYDCQIFYSKEPSDEEMDALKALPYVRSVQKLGYFESVFTFGERSAEAVVNSVEADSELIGIFDKDENRLYVRDDAIVLERHTAEKLGAKKGDTIKVDGVDFVISDISEQSLSRFQYISENSAKKLGEVSLGCVLLNVDEADEQKLLSHLTEREGYLFSVFTRVAYAGNEKTFKTYDLATAVIIGFAVLIGFTIVYNTAQTNLLEKKKELCVLRTLGFTHGEISASWFVQTLLQFLCSLVVGLPFGVYIAKTALYNLSNEVREFVFANTFKEYFFTAALVFVYVTVSHLLSMNSMKKWDMVETVKEKE